jgi:hypothetical protein
MLDPFNGGGNSQDFSRCQPHQIFFVADAATEKARVFVCKVCLMFSSKAGVHLSGAPSGVYV